MDHTEKVMQYLLLFLFLIIFESFIFLPSVNAQTIGNGDANNDEKVDSKDIQFILQSYGQSKAIPTDQYGDGVINTLDIKVVVSFINTSAILNVKNFGAKGDGVTNDQKAFADALASLVAKGGGKLYVPAGTYRVEKPLGQKLAAIRLTGLSNIEISGDGATSSILKLRALSGSGDSSIIGVLRSDNIIIRNLGFDGDLKATLLAIGNNKSNGVYVLNSKQVLVEKAKFDSMSTAGTYLIGTNDLECPAAHCFADTVTIKDSEFVNNFRAGAANQGGIRNVSYINNSYDKTGSGQDIDFEPTGTRPGAENVTITNNKLLTTRGDYGLSLAGTSLVGKNWIVTGNTINRAVLIMRIDGLNFSNNTVNSIGRSFQIRSLKNATFVSNRLTGGIAEMVHLAGPGRNSGIKFADNTMYLGTPSTRAIRTEGPAPADNITITDNKIVGPVGGSNLNAYVLAIGSSNLPEVTKNDLVIVANKFWRVPPAQILVATSDFNVKFDTVNISDNIYYSNKGDSFVIRYGDKNDPDLFIKNLIVNNNTVQPEIPAP